MRPVLAEHRFALRIYDADVDLTGMVHSASYLRFIERGRTECLRGLGMDLTRLKQVQGVVLPIVRLEADYLHPAGPGDLLFVETLLVSRTAVRLTFAQTILHERRRLFAAHVVLACMDDRGRARRLPSG